MRILKQLVRMVGLLLLLAGLAGIAGAWYVLRPIPMREPVVDFDIESGTPMSRIAVQVEAAGLQVWPRALSTFARFSGHAVKIKAGSYRIDKPVSMWDLVLLMSSGANAYADFRIIEGWNFQRLRAELAANPQLRQDTAGLSGPDIMARLGLPGTAPEGMFAPDTYSFSRGSSDLDLLRRAMEHMKRNLDRAWASRDASLPIKTPYDALKLASVVEKETGRAEDRGLVASVFVNRLRIGMPLQSDPTVIYGIGENYTGTLRRRDLQTDTPFNSYTRGGLPPTPIAMPGKAAIEAVMRPATSDYYYFVARGDGSSQFSRTLDEHNRAVVRYLRSAGK